MIAKRESVRPISYSTGKRMETKGKELNTKELTDEEKAKIARREYNRQWYAKNKEKRREYSRKWNAKNKEKRREYHKKWRKKNRDKVKAINQRYFAKMYDEKIAEHE